MATTNRRQFLSTMAATATLPTFRKNGTRPTVGQYNVQLKKSLVASGFSPEEAAAIVSIAKNQQEAYNIFENATLWFLPGKTPSV